MLNNTPREATKEWLEFLGKNIEKNDINIDCIYTNINTMNYVKGEKISAYVKEQGIDVVMVCEVNWNCISWELMNLKDISESKRFISNMVFHFAGQH